MIEKAILQELTEYISSFSPYAVQPSKEIVFKLAAKKRQTQTLSFEQAPLTEQSHSIDVFADISADISADTSNTNFSKEAAKCVIESNAYLDTTPLSLEEIASPSQPSALSETTPFEGFNPVDNYIQQNKTDQTFQSALFAFIDGKGLTDSAIYKSANIDRRHFSKIRSNPTYRPKKQTVLSLCFALHLTKAEAEELLTLAGYTLSPSNIADLIVQFFFEKKRYSLEEVNEALLHFSQPLLTS